VSESVLDRRRNSRGRPLNTYGPLTQKAWTCMRVVWANGTERTPLPAERRERPLVIPHNDQSGKLEQCLTSTSYRSLKEHKYIRGWGKTYHQNCLVGSYTELEHCMCHLMDGTQKLQSWNSQANQHQELPKTPLAQTTHQYSAGPWVIKTSKIIKKTKKSWTMQTRIQMFACFNKS